MKRVKKLTMLLVILFSIIMVNLYAAEKNEVNKTFKPAETVEIKTINGSCIFKTGSADEIKVSLVHNYPADVFDPVFKEEGNSLILEEKFKEDAKFNNGSSSWTVTVPEKTNIKFKTVSGDFTAAGLKADIKGMVVSGNIDVSDLNGKLSLEAVSGDVKLQKATGELKIKAVSGNINASDITIKGVSSFNCISGDIDVNLANAVEYDLSMKTISGDITLNYNGNLIKGYFSFKGQKGNINSPIPFDNPDEAESRNPFIKKYFKKDSDSPKIFLETISGELTLKK